VSWVKPDRGVCPNRKCRAANWDTPRREYRVCPVDGVSFEVEWGSRKIYHDTPCYIRHFSTAVRRRRRKKTAEFNVVMSRERPSPDMEERRR